MRTVYGHVSRSDGLSKSARVVPVNRERYDLCRPSCVVKKSTLSSHVLSSCFAQRQEFTLKNANNSIMQAPWRGGPDQIRNSSTGCCMTRTPMIKKSAIW